MSKAKIKIILFCTLIIFFPTFLFHILTPNWDFIVYELHAKYFCFNGKYFEWFRPPLVSLFLCVFPKPIFLFLSSLFFVLTVLNFCKKFRISDNFLKLLILFPLTLFFNNISGSDLLALTFLILSLFTFPKFYSAIFFGFSFLTRYNYFIFLPLFLWLGKSNRKNLFQFFALTSLIIFPWLFYNFALKNDFLFSIKNSLKLNIQERNFTINFLDIFIIVIFSLILFVFLLRCKNFKSEKTIFFLIFFILSLVSYVTIPKKEIRYLLPISIPVSYFILNSFKNFRRVLWFLVILDFLIIIIFCRNLIFSINRLTWEDIEFIFQKIKNKKCISSNLWPFFNYKNLPTLPLPFHPKVVEDYMKKGFTFVIYKHGEIPSSLWNYSFLTLYEDKNFLILKSENECNLSIKKVEVSYEKVEVEYE